MAAVPTRPADFAFPVRIYWEDTDAGGIVFYANYLRFFERARTEWLRALGHNQQELRDRTGGMFIVSDTRMRYLRPARLDDVLHVTVRMVEQGRSALTMAQQAWRDAELLCEGEIRIGWVEHDAASGELRPRRVPAEVLAALGQQALAASPNQKIQKTS